VEPNIESMRREWVERCASNAEAFIRNARKEGVDLNYSRESLQAAETHLQKRKTSLRDKLSERERLQLIDQATAYLAQVILKNLGGELDIDTATEEVSVEKIGGQEIKALPSQRINKLINQETKEPLTAYYDRIAETLEKTKTGAITINREELWKHAERIAHDFRSMDKTHIKNTGDLTPILLPLAWCLSCNRLGALAIIPLTTIPEDLRKKFPETVRHAVSQAREQPCQRCGAELIPLGYIHNTLAWYIPRPPDGSTPDRPPSQHPERQEAYITTLNTTVGRTLFITGKILRKRNKVVKIEEDQAETPETSPFLATLPNTPLYY